MKLLKFKLTKKRVIISVVLVAILAGFFFFKGRTNGDIDTATVIKGTILERFRGLGLPKGKR